VDVQQRLVDELRELGLNGFYAEHFDGNRSASHVGRMCLGRHWNAKSRQWEEVRGNIDGRPVDALPDILQHSYKEAVARANREFTRGRGKKKLAALPVGVADLAVVEHYGLQGSSGMHQERNASESASGAALPVMVVAIGDSCEFAYADAPPQGTQKPKVLRLESGDVVVFGGPSHTLWHGVSRVLARTAPPQMRLVPGHLAVMVRGL